MPGIDGLQLLTAIKAQWPDTIRVMLTGNTDMETAVNAINEGSIFRFLNKPCSKKNGENLDGRFGAVPAGDGQETTLGTNPEQQHPGADRSLSLVNPAAFSRAGGPAATFTTS